MAPAYMAPEIVVDRKSKTATVARTTTTETHSIRVPPTYFELSRGIKLIEQARDHSVDDRSIVSPIKSRLDGYEQGVSMYKFWFTVMRETVDESPAAASAGHTGSHPNNCKKCKSEHYEAVVSGATHDRCEGGC